MPIEDDVRAILAEPHESLTLDFKESVGWGSLGARIELARDIVCLANRSGGQIVIGVKDLGGGRFDAVGLIDTDDLPDPTELGKVIRKYFDPPASFTVHDVLVDERRFGVVRVSEFTRYPIVCKTIGNDENGRAVVRPALIYRRSDAMECTSLETAGGVQSIIESAVAKTGAAARRMVETASTETEAQPASVVRTVPEPLASSDETLRVCDLTPTPPGDFTTPSAMMKRLEDAVVRTHGGVTVPRSIDPRFLEPSAVVREPGRLLIQKARDDLGRASSLIEIAAGLRLHLREGLWEDEGRVDFTSLFGFTFACLHFARMFYDGTSATAIEVRLGLTGALGRQLVDDPSKFTGFHRSYVATTDKPLVVQRSISMVDLNDADLLRMAGRDMISELSEYFGFVLNDQAFDAHLDHVASNVPDLRQYIP